MRNKYSISIITVKKNDDERFSKTRESIVEFADFDDIEHVVIQYAEKEYQRALPKTEGLKLSTVYLLGRDDGIYDAMNRGAAIARARWIIYLNCGDTLVSSFTLVKVFLDTALDLDEALVLYSSVFTKTKCGGPTGVLRCRNLRDLRYRMAFSHQACLIDRNTLNRRRYDTTYSYAADHKFFADLYSSSPNAFRFIAIPFSSIERGGVSDKNRIAVYKEQLRFASGNNGRILIYLRLFKEKVLQILSGKHRD